MSQMAWTTRTNEEEEEEDEEVVHDLTGGGALAALQPPAASAVPGLRNTPIECVIRMATYHLHACATKSQGNLGMLTVFLRPRSPLPVRPNCSLVKFKLSLPWQAAPMTS